MTLVVAFGHQSRVGKDTAAKYLVSLLRASNKYPRGVMKMSFATPLKDMAHQLWTNVGVMPGEHYEEHPEDRKLVLPKIGKDVVQMWIELGQKVREIYADTWSGFAMERAKLFDAVVFSDLRFPNEGDAVHAAGGVCWDVVNPRVTETRASDHFLDNWPGFDGILVNAGTIKDLNNLVEMFAKKRGWL